jgi:FtsZ-binding cell division protein ZapB
MPSKPRKPARKSPRTAKPKAGHSSTAATRRRAAFVERLLVNGHNATEAAWFAGYTAKQLNRIGWSLLQEPKVKAALAARALVVANLADLTTANWATALRSILLTTAGDLYDAVGNLIPVHALPAHVQAAISTVKFKHGEISEIKLWNKNAALETAARHLGLFERDNAQTKSDIRVSIELVG